MFSGIPGDTYAECGKIVAKTGAYITILRYSSREFKHNYRFVWSHRCRQSQEIDTLLPIENRGKDSNKEFKLKTTSQLPALTIG